MGYYPRVRAKKHLANFTSYPTIEGPAKPLNFFGYKAGMISVFAKNAHEKSVSFGQDTTMPATVIECPPVKIFGARVYGKTHYGLKVLGEATIDKVDKHFRKRHVSFKKKGKKKKEEKKYSTFGDLEKMKGEAAKIVLLAEIRASETAFGKKKSDIAEITLGGSLENQFIFAKEKFGKELRITDVFGPQQFIDVKAVDKGKGFQGPVKRFGVKVHRPKAKKHRYVGSISPWHPPTVMWTVPRPGQMGYQTRTELNKRILAIDNDVSLVNPPGGFSQFGVVKSEYVVVLGSIPGAPKRPISMRVNVRPIAPTHKKFTDIKMPFGNIGEKKAAKETAEIDAQ